MKQSLGRRSVLVLAFVAAFATTFWACSSPPTVGATVSCGPFTGGLVIGPGGEPTVLVDGPSDICWKITFVGADGANISTDTVTCPGASQVPPGTVRIDYDPVPCPEPPELAPPGSGSPYVSTRALPVPTWHDVYSYPLDFSSLNGAICHARVWCGPNQDPSAILRPVLLAGPGAAVPPNVRILFFSDVQPSAVGATVRVAAPRPILGMNLTWNGITNFADLETGVNAVPGVLANDWSTVEFYVAESDVDLTLWAWNRAALSLATLGQQPEQHALAFQILSN